MRKCKKSYFKDCPVVMMTTLASVWEMFYLAKENCGYVKTEDMWVKKSLGTTSRIL